MNSKIVNISNDHEGYDGNDRFLFVVATRKTKDEYDIAFESTPLFKCLYRMDEWCMPYTDVLSYFENSDGLPKVYNDAISKYGNKYDFIVFIHDDVWLNDVMFFDKIVSASKDFDIIGCCGGKSWEKLDDESRPMIWTHASRNGGMSGFMAHAAPKEFNGSVAEFDYNGRTIFSTNYGNSPSRVLTIDGSFMCFTKRAVEAGVRFDERFEFHFYDMDVCFDAFVKKQRVGTAPILLTHESLGYSVMQPEYMVSQRKFLDKWFKKVNG